MSRSDIGGQVFGNNARADQITAILGYLAAKVSIETQAMTTGGRPRTEYRLEPPGTFFSNPVHGSVQE